MGRESMMSSVTSLTTKQLKWPFYHRLVKCKCPQYYYNCINRDITLKFLFTQIKKSKLASQAFLSLEKILLENGMQQMVVGKS